MTVNSKTPLIPNYTLASVLTSLGGFLNGYGTGSIGSLTSMPQFHSSIGLLSPSQLGFTVSLIMLAGAIPSVFAGTLADKLGRLRVVLIGAILFVVGATIEASVGGSRGLIIFNIGCALAGLGEGVYLSCVSTYVSNFSPSLSSNPTNKQPLKVHLRDCTLFLPRRPCRPPSIPSDVGRLLRLLHLLRHDPRLHLLLLANTTHHPISHRRYPRIILPPPPRLPPLANPQRARHGSQSRPSASQLSHRRSRAGHPPPNHLRPETQPHPLPIPNFDIPPPLPRPHNPRPLPPRHGPTLRHRWGIVLRAHTLHASRPPQPNIILPRFQLVRNPNAANQHPHLSPRRRVEPTHLCDYGRDQHEHLHAARRLFVRSPRRAPVRRSTMGSRGLGLRLQPQLLRNMGRRGQDLRVRDTSRAHQSCSELCGAGTGVFHELARRYPYSDLVE